MSDLTHLYLPDDFKNSEFLCVIPFREELGLIDGSTKLSPELTEWLTEQAPDTKWTARADNTKGGKLVLIFKFASDAEMVHFKLRWWD